MSETCRNCAGSIERKGPEQVCYSCLEKELEAREREAAELKEEIADRADTESSLTKCILENGENIAALEKECASVTAERDVEAKRAREAEKECASLREDLEKYKSRYLAQEIIELRKKIEELEEVIKKLRKVNFVGNDGAVSDLVKTLEALDKARGRDSGNA